ncbi:MAG: trigger factor [Lachnospiraceae bacterium]|nr:trigger factor [Lachnospiraceae bacterium]
MSLQVEKLEKNMAKLTIEVSAEELEAAIEVAYQKNKNKISVPGFRKGKVPRKMIEKMYGPAIFYEDAANELIPTAYEKALEECEEEIVSSPQIDVVQIEAGKPFIFTAEVALKPEVSLGKYKGVKVEAADVTVTEEEIDAQIQRERENSARTITVEDRAVKDGDMTVIDFEGFVDGVAFEGGKGTDYPLTIGSGAFIPGFEEQLVGAEIGKEVEVNVTFPAEYHAADLAGKPAVFKCTVKSITEKQLPELDDEFASEVSVFDTLAEYREDVKKTLEMKKNDEAKRAKEDAVIDAIVADSAMEIPEAMIETQQRQIVDEFAQRLQMQGLSMEQYFQFTGLNPQMMLEQVKPQALSRIQSRLVLEAIVKAEGIEATEEDFDAEAAKMAETYQMELDKVKEVLGENGKKQVMQDIAIAKAVEFVVAEAKEGAAKKTTAKKTTKKAEDAEEAPAKKTAAKKTTKKAETEEAPAKKPAAKKTTKKAAEKTEE